MLRVFLQMNFIFLIHQEMQKNYGYTIQQGKVVCKVRGFTLNVCSAAVLNFQTIKDNILAELENPLDHRRPTNVVTPYYFQRDLE